MRSNKWCLLRMRPKQRIFHIDDIPCFSCNQQSKKPPFNQFTMIFQALIRGGLVRNEIRQRLKSAVTIQSNWRRYLAQKKYQLVLDTVIQIQAIVKGKQVRKIFEELKENNDLPCFHQGNDVQKTLILISETGGRSTDEEIVIETEPEEETEFESEDETETKIVIEESSSEDEG